MLFGFDNFIKLHDTLCSGINLFTELIAAYRILIEKIGQNIVCSVNVFGILGFQRCNKQMFTLSGEVAWVVADKTEDRSHIDLECNGHLAF